MGGASLLYQAGMAVSSGVVDMVLCLGAGTPMNISTQGAVRTWRYEADFQKPFGMMGPNSQFAFILRRHMYQYGTKPEGLGKVAIIQREHAIKNPNAYLKTPLAMEQYLGSRMIADPIRLFDACILGKWRSSVHCCFKGKSETNCRKTNQFRFWELRSQITTTMVQQQDQT